MVIKAKKKKFSQKRGQKILRRVSAGILGTVTLKTPREERKKQCGYLREKKS